MPAEIVRVRPGRHITRFRHATNGRSEIIAAEVLGAGGGIVVGRIPLDLRHG